MKKIIYISVSIAIFLSHTAFAQDPTWIPLPDGMHVELFHDKEDEHLIAFLLNLNSYKISSFHVDSSLEGEQHYDTDVVGWTHYRHGDPTITITSYGSQKWIFDAEDGNFWWQNFENVSNFGDPSYKLLFRLTNTNFTDSTTFKYYIDQAVPEPSSIALLATGGVVIFIWALKKSQHGIF